MYTSPVPLEYLKTQRRASPICRAWGSGFKVLCVFFAQQVLFRCTDKQPPSTRWHDFYSHPSRKLLDCHYRIFQPCNISKLHDPSEVGSLLNTIPKHVHELLFPISFLPFTIDRQAVLNAPNEEILPFRSRRLVLALLSIDSELCGGFQPLEPKVWQHPLPCSVALGTHNLPYRPQPLAPSSRTNLCFFYPNPPSRPHRLHQPLLPSLYVLLLAVLGFITLENGLSCNHGRLCLVPSTRFSSKS